MHNFRREVCLFDIGMTANTRFALAVSLGLDDANNICR